MSLVVDFSNNYFTRNCVATVVVSFAINIRNIYFKNCLIRISLPVGTTGKPLAAIGKFANVISKLMIVKTFVSKGEEITNVIIGND